MRHYDSGNQKITPKKVADNPTVLTWVTACIDSRSKKKKGGVQAVTKSRNLMKNYKLKKTKTTITPLFTGIIGLLVRIQNTASLGSP
jgi:hypothetical protein